MSSPQTSPLTARREELSRTTELYKQSIEDQVSNLKQDAGKVGRVALGVGGAALATYLVARAVKSRKAKKKQKHKAQQSLASGYMHPYQIASAAYASSAYVTPSAYALAPVTKTVPKVASPVSSLIKQQITLFLGAVARQVVAKAIERIGKNDTKRIEHTYRP